MTTVSTALADPPPSSSAVTTIARWPELQSRPAKTTGSIFCSQASAVLSAQSCASLHRFGISQPIVGSVPAATSFVKLPDVEEPAGTWLAMQLARDVASVKYGQAV